MNSSRKNDEIKVVIINTQVATSYKKKIHKNSTNRGW